MDWKIEAAIYRLLKKKIGLDANTLGSSRAIAKAVSDRMNDCNILDIPTYLTYLESSPPEWEALIEQVIVPETWFFRDREAFNFLRKYIISEWFPQKSLQRLRILSVPCSTGEEPFSIAITLLEAGLAPNQFRIDAVDISKLSLAKAKRGVYGKNSFRGQNFSSPNSPGFALKNRYFQPTSVGGEQYQISPQVKSTVNLIVGNIVDPFFVQNLSARYQIIFCRNLLIYFDSDSRAKALQAIDRLLNPEGLLFVGAAETGLLMQKGFTSVRHPMSFAYKKNQTQVKTSQDPVVWKIAPKNLSSTPSNYITSNSSNHASNKSIQLPPQNQVKRTLVHGLKPTKKTLLPNGQNSDNSSLLDNARILANQGKLQESANLCQTYLSQNPTSVQAYVLLGEVHQALGNDDRAEQCFQKAVYLDPNHYQALIHLALLTEQRGDISNAAAIRQRIDRLDRQS